MTTPGAQHVFDQFRIDGRTAVVTGGAGLLGREFVRTLAAAGATVIACDCDADRLGAVVAPLRQQGLAVQPVETDVTSPASVQGLIAHAQAAGGLDILVNSAALDPKFGPGEVRDSGAFEDLSLEAWNAALAVNLSGVFLCCQHAVPVMRRKGSGSIINLCSTYGLVGPDQRIYQRAGQPPRFKPAHYATTKAGVLGLTRHLATYLAGTGVRVNCLTPGGVFDQHDEEFVRAYAARTILGRMARPDEMNGALLFLASDASSYMTGSNVVVDGGWTTW